MGIERETTVNETSKQSERLKPGHKLLLAGPGSLMAFGFRRNKLSSKEELEFNEKKLFAISTEWYSIYSLLTKLVGKENIVVSKTDITVGKNKEDFSIKFESIDLPKELSFGAIKIPFLSKAYSCWPRDAYTVLDDRILANMYAWGTPPDGIKLSGLGEQGKVLTKNKSILVTPDKWKGAKKEINALIREGFKIGCLPFVNAFKQAYEFVDRHIDGHSALIEDKKGELVLLVLDSYFRQAHSTKDLIKQAADTVGARVHEVDDGRLSPLALNLIQFEDRSIAFTDSEARDLELTLSLLVGSDKIFTTDVPLVQIPKNAGGGMRCMSNILTPSLNNLLTKMTVSEMV